MRRVPAAAVVLSSLLATAGLVAAAAAPVQGLRMVTIHASPDPSTTGGTVLIEGDAAFSARRVVLWQRLVGARRFRAIAGAAVQRGSYTITRAPRTNRWWFVRAGGVRSRSVYERVRAAVALTATASRPSVERLSGKVVPTHKGERVLLEQRVRGRWRVLVKPRLSRSSSFDVVHSFTGPAFVRAVFPGDWRNVRSASAITAIKSTPPTRPIAPTPPPRRPRPRRVRPKLTVTAALGTSRPLPPNYFGVNWSAGAAFFTNDLSAQYSSLAALHPGTLRWPGGTGANYFQWQNGRAAPTSPFRFTLQDLEAAHRATGAPPLFDLNLLTSTLQSQVTMLQTARSLGLPIKYLELGNEFNLAAPAYVKAFPTAADYGRVVGRWVTTLHEDFPGALVAAVGAERTYNERQRTWNARMLAAAKSAGGLPDAITLHAKPSMSRAVTVANLPTLFAGPYRVVAQAKADLARLPDPLPAWMTEYNLAPTSVGNPAEKIYAQAPFVAEYALLLQRVGNARLVDYWTSLNAYPSAAYTASPQGTPALTPAGLGLEWVGDAASGARTSTPIRFGRGPALSKGRPALIGYQFTGSSGSREVIINLSSHKQTAAAGAAIPPGDHYTQVTGKPLQPIAYASQLPIATGTIADRLPLPPYSITLVR